MSSVEMPAAVYLGEGAMAVREVPIPVPGPGEVLVEVSHCGICGTDLHLVLEEYARPGSVLGHEWAGTVAAGGTTGDGMHPTGPTAADWEPGARVVAGPSPGCGTCRACRRGRPSVCLRRDPPDLLAFRGAFCPFVTVRAERLLRIPDALATREAALTEPTAIALHAVTLSGVRAGDRALVTGGGAVGLLTVAVLLARGVTDITVSEPVVARRARARSIGAANTVTPDELGPAPMGRPIDAPYTVAFECSGSVEAAEAALDQLDYAGTLVLVGTGSRLPRLNHNRMIVLELTVVGAYNYDAGGFEEALALLASGALPLDHLVEPVDVPLEGVLDAMRHLARGDLTAKVLVRPEHRR